jgi:hypothetical protein
MQSFTESWPLLYTLNSGTIKGTIIMGIICQVCHDLGTSYHQILEFLMPTQTIVPMSYQIRLPISPQEHHQIT